jgi:RNA polymerase sigma-70 factor (ECF subfamily)
MVKDAPNVPGRGAASEGHSTPSPSLLQGLKAQDPGSWRRLAGLYGPLVYAWCRGRWLQPSDTEDVLQEVFLTVAARVGDFRREQPGDTFRGWLWVITRNKLGDWLRRQRGREAATRGSEALRLLEEVPGGDVSSGPAGGEPGDLHHRALEAIRAEFTEQSWQAFRRVVIDGGPPADVALELGVSRNAVYVAKSRILRRLREVLGENA